MATRRRRMIADPRANQAVAFSAAVAGNTAIDAAAIVSGSVAAAAVLAHEGASDPHPTYMTAAEGDAAYSPIAKGVTNGDSHDHSGGDGAQIAYSSLSGLPPVQLSIPISTYGGANITLTTHPNSQQFFANSARNIVPVDLTGYTSLRMFVRVMTSSASANSPRVYLAYLTTFSATAGDYSTSPCSTDVSCSLSATGMIDTGWLTLSAGAKTDVFLAVLQNGGDGAESPVVGRITAWARV